MKSGERRKSKWGRPLTPLHSSHYFRIVSRTLNLPLWTRTHRSGKGRRRTRTYVRDVPYTQDESKRFPSETGYPTGSRPLTHPFRWTRTWTIIFSINGLLYSVQEVIDKYGLNIYRRKCRWKQNKELTKSWICEIVPQETTLDLSDWLSTVHRLLVVGLSWGVWEKCVDDAHVVTQHKVSLMSLLVLFKSSVRSPWIYCKIWVLPPRIETPVPLTKCLFSVDGSKSKYIGLRNQLDPWTVGVYVEHCTRDIPVLETESETEPGSPISFRIGYRTITYQLLSLPTDLRRPIFYTQLFYF